MKKLGIIMLVVGLLVGCTAKKEAGSESTWNETLIKENVISIGVSPDYPPYESLDVNGNLEGFDIDFMTEVVSILNAKEEANYEIEWVQMEFSTIITSLQMGQLDLGVSGFTYDEKRDVLFSTPYIESATFVLTNGNEDIQSIDDLEGKVIGVQLGSTGETAAKEIKDAQVISISDVNIMMESLKSNAYDAVALDQGVAMKYVNNSGFTLVEGSLIDDSMYVIAKNGKTLLMDKINEAIEEFKGTEKYQELLEKWDLK